MAYVISDEGAYILGLVNGLYLPIYIQKLMLSPMKAFINQG